MWNLLISLNQADLGNYLTFVSIIARECLMGAEYPEKNTLKRPNIQPLDVHLIQCPDVRRKSTMHAQNLPVYQGGHSQKIKNLE